MPSRYKAGVLSSPKSFYFSVGDHKYTVRLTPSDCTVESGKTVENADCVLKTTEDLFEGMVLHGKAPGAMDLMRGRFKTNDPNALLELKGLFAF
jgi:hypothetical protein